MNMDRFPLGAPLVEISSDGRQYPYTLARDFVYMWPGYGHWKPFDVCVPAGYATDFLSIPKAFWPIMPPVEAGCWGALPHDILYSSEYSLPGQPKDEARAMADMILYDAIRDAGCSRVRASIIYNAVRMGGGFTWKDHHPADVTDDLQSLAEATERWERYRTPSP